MTAGSVEYMPCVVPPVRMTGTNRVDAETAPIPSTPKPKAAATPTTTPINNVRRNLFGCAEPGSAENLRRAEEEHKCKEWNNRFTDFEEVIRIPMRNSTATNSFNVKIESSPNLIDLEIEKHQEKLAKEKCNKITTVQQLQEKTETTPQQPQRKINCSRTAETANNNKNSNSINSSSSSSQTEIISNKQFRNLKQLEHCNTTTTDEYLGINHHSSGNCNERIKPYSRQTTITECFTVRKTPKTLNGKILISKSESQNQNKQQQKHQHRRI